MPNHLQIQNDFERLIERGTLGGSYIFFGPDSGAKRELAEGLAAYLETGSWPPAREGEETSVRPLTDARVFLPVEETIGIDTAREIREFLGASPLLSVRRVAIVDRAEAMTTEAQNALLKLAEEPPPRALLIFVLRDPEALAPALLSRFQKVYVPGGGKAKLLSTAGEERAREFLAAAPGGRKELLKALLEPEDFSLTAFLDDLIRVLSLEKKPNSGLWHAVLELRRAADNSPLNPKLQLLSLWTHT